MHTRWYFGIFFASLVILWMNFFMLSRMLALASINLCRSFEAAGPTGTPHCCSSPLWLSAADFHTQFISGAHRTGHRNHMFEEGAAKELRSEAASKHEDPPEYYSVCPTLHRKDLCPGKACSHCSAQTSPIHKEVRTTHTHTNADTHSSF